jgi:hypothetical protein
MDDGEEGLTTNGTNERKKRKEYLTQRRRAAELLSVNPVVFHAFYIP